MTDTPISSGSGTTDDPWQLKTPPLGADYTMHRDTKDGLDVLLCSVGKTVLWYDARCLDDLHAMLIAHGDWMELGAADEQKPAKDGTVEAWGRDPRQPDRRLVRPEEGLPRPLRHVRAAAHGAPRPGRARAQGARQPNARDLTRFVQRYSGFMKSKRAPASHSERWLP